MTGGNEGGVEQVAAVELMQIGSGYISKVESTRICYGLSEKGERKSEVKDVSKGFGLSNWKMDGDQCDRSRCCWGLSQELSLGLVNVRCDSQVESQVSS